MSDTPSSYESECAAVIAEIQALEGWDHMRKPNVAPRFHEEATKAAEKAGCGKLEILKLWRDLAKEKKLSATMDANEGLILHLD